MYGSVICQPCCIGQARIGNRKSCRHRKNIVACSTVDQRLQNGANGSTQQTVNDTAAQVAEEITSFTTQGSTKKRQVYYDNDVLWERVVDGDEVRQILQECEGVARVFTPYFRPPPPSLTVTKLPLMLYLPGIDGTGLAAYRSFPGLATAFDLKVLVVPTNSRQAFEELVATVIEYLEFEASQEIEPPGRPVYLMGESFGSLLAMAVAAGAQHVVDRVIIVNPATSFPLSPWLRLAPLIAAMPEAVYNNVFPYALMPILTNPAKLVARLIPDGAGPQEAGAQLLEDLPRLLTQLGVLPEVLPRDTLLWRLGLIQRANEYLEVRWLKVKARVLALLADNDLMLPSGEEADFLQATLTRCQVRIMKDHGHALLQEEGADIVKILKEEGFYTTERRLSSWPPNPQGRLLARFGQPGPIELPTSTEFQIQRKTTEPYASVQRLQSPVFFSTTPDGDVVKGLGALPKTGPVLFVGNHQIMGADLGTLVAQVFLETGRLPRGLGHPCALMDGFAQVAEQQERLKVPNVQRRMANRRDREESLPRTDKLFETWGAVPVSVKSMIKLLQLGEPVLLFPGGSKEACKESRDAYKLFWPENAEFVRIAAKMGATIIPFAAIGCEENQATLISSDRLRSIPQVRATLAEWYKDMPKARTGVNEQLDEYGLPEDIPIPNFNLPTAPPERLYFLFQKPIPLSTDMASQREECAEIYKDVKSEVADGIQYLLTRRNDDPYRNFVLRMAYEAAQQGQQAPTFEP